MTLLILKASPRQGFPLGLCNASGKNPMSGTLITELEEGNAKGAVQPVPATTVMV